MLVNVLYRRPGAASARWASVVAREAVAIACRGHLSQQEKAALHSWGCSWGLNPPVSRSARVM